MKSALFLHMGPGLNAFVERALMGEQQPEVLFWDQPATTGPNAFDNLVQHAVSMVDELHRTGGRPIRLIAHSFGGHVARAILNFRPEAVQECVFFNTGYSTANGFHLLLQQMQNDDKTPVELKEKITDFLQQNPMSKKECLWDYAALISQDPDFMRLYWPSAQLYKEYRLRAQKAPPLLFNVFQDVLNSFYEKPNAITKSIWNGKLKLVLGSQDPLIDVKLETIIWKKIFPNLELVVKPGSGHYSHLEPYFR